MKYAEYQKLQLISAELIKGREKTTVRLKLSWQVGAGAREQEISIDLDAIIHGDKLLKKIEEMIGKFKAGIEDNYFPPIALPKFGGAYPEYTPKVNIMNIIEDTNNQKELK